MVRNIGQLLCTNLAEGSHIITTVAVDAVGRVEQIGVTIVFIVDFSPPESTVELQPSSASIVAQPTASLHLRGTDRVTRVVRWRVQHLAAQQGVFPSDVWADSLGNGFMSMTQLSQGNHSVRVVAEDAAGNQELHPAGASWIVDLSPPTTQLLCDGLNSGSVISSTFATCRVAGWDSVTHVVRWEIEHTGPVATWPATTSDPSFVVHGLAEGHHALTAFSVDAAGNRDPTGSSVFWIVDVTPPVTLAVLQGPSVTTSNAVRVAVQGLDTTSNATEWVVTHRGPPALFTSRSREAMITFTAVADGEHWADLYAVDSAGNQDAHGAQVSWTVDTVPPTTTVHLMSPAICSTPRAALQLGGTDATTAVREWRIRHTSPSALVLNRVVSDATVQLDGLTDEGEHVFTAWAIDVVGNTDPVGATVRWTIDLSPPTTHVDILSKVPSRETHVQVELGGTDNVTAISCWKLRHSGPVATVPSACVTGRQLFISNCGEGLHELQAFSVDAAGNMDPRGTSVSWITDFSSPTTFATLAGPSLTNSTSVAVSVGGADTLTIVASWQITHWHPSGVSLSTALTPTVQIMHCQDGSHLVQVQAIDAAGNLDAVGMNITFHVDTLPPVASFVLYPNALVNASQVTMQVHVSEPVSNLLAQLDDLPPQQLDSGQHVSFDGIVDGHHMFLVTCTDLAGNAMVKPLVGSPFTVDTTPIAQATVEFDEVDATGGRLITAKPDVRLRFLQQDADDRSCWDCELQVAVSGPEGHRTASSRGPQGILRIATQTDGIWILQPMAIDAAGNSRKLSPLQVIRDTNPPKSTVTASSVAHQGFTNHTIVELVLSSTKPNQTRYHVDGYADADESLVVRGNPATVRLTGLSDGSHCIYIQAEDAAHNLEVTPLSWCWIVDTIAPESVWKQPPASMVGVATVSGLLANVQADVVTRVFARNATGYTLSAPCFGAMCAVNVTNDGSWLIWLQGLDRAGNAERPAQAQTVLVDTTAPLLSWATTLQEGAVQKSPDWSAFVTSLDLTRIVFRAQCVHAQSGTEALVIISDNRFQVHGLHDGIWNIAVYATDQVGHVSDPLTHEWVVDLTPPRVSAVLPPRPIVNVTNHAPLFASTPICVQVSCFDALTGCSMQFAIVMKQQYIAAGCGSAASSNADVASVWKAIPPSGILCADRLVSGLYHLDLVVTDGAGNAQLAPAAWTFSLDTDGAAAPVLEVAGVDTFQTKDTTLQATVTLTGDASPLPELMQLWYQLDTAAAVMLQDVKQSAAQQSAPLALRGLRDGPHVLTAWTVDAAGNKGLSDTYQWTIQSAAPDTRIDHRPSATADIGLMVWEFHVYGVVAQNTSTGSASAPIAGLQVKVDSQEWRSVCGGSVGTSICKVPVIVSNTGPHTFAARATNTLGVTDPEPELAQWTVRQCGGNELSSIDAVSGIITCGPCPDGGECFGGRATPSQVVARAGYWASSQNSKFYDCPLQDACVGGNGSVRAMCATGYTGVLCGMCEPGYYLQFGQCSACPKDATSAWFYMIGAAVLVLLLAGSAVAARKYLPQTTMKIGLAMLQIIGNANTAFAAPWPAEFVALVNAMKVFMLELLALTRTSCATPVTFYTAFSVNVFGMTAVSVLIAGGLVAAGRIRKAPVASAAQLLKPLFMFWLLCYPAVSLKLFQLFKCLDVEGSSLLVADMRLRCYDSTWWAYAAIAIAYLLLFTTGLPLGIAAFLFRRRRELDAASTITEAGFLYSQYGPQAYAWEAVELVRKLVLTCALTLLDPTTPVPLTLAVLVSALAQVLHAAYKPFVERKYYYLQHGSLACTLFVFTIGLMFKVKQTGIGATVLAVLLVGVCTIMIIALLWVGLADVWTTIRHARRAQAVAKSTKSGRTFVPKPESALMQSNPLHGHPADSSSATTQPGSNDPLRKIRVAALKARSFQPVGSQSVQ